MRIFSRPICGHVTLLILLALTVAITTTGVSLANAEQSEINFWLTVLHNNDSDSQMVAVGKGQEDLAGVARFAKLIRSLKREAKKERGARGVILLSSGDNFLAGPQFKVSSEGGRFFESIAAKRIKYDAMGFGNHDFDFGPDVLAAFLSGIRRKRTPFVISNLDFSAEPALQALVEGKVIVPSVVLKRKGRRIGIVGAMTPRLRFISSPGKVKVNDDMAATTQREIDKLRGDGVNIIILISDFLSIHGDMRLAASLREVDIIMAGGGRELLSNPGVLLLPGDENQVFGPYPLTAPGLDGKDVLLVSTTGDHRYVGRLVVGFNAKGEIKAVDRDKSGPIRVVGGNNPDSVKPDRKLERKIATSLSQRMASLASSHIGTSEIPLDGRREQVRTRETNAGNLVADALLAQATALAVDFGTPPPEIAIQNSGGIVNGNVIPAGRISELDTFLMLRFPNIVSIVSGIAPGQLKEILENAVSRVELVDGRFPQIAGFKLAWDSSGVAQIVDSDGAVLTPGTRVREIVLNDGREIVKDGQLVAEAPSVSIATLEFLIRGGDEYPFRQTPYVSLGITYQQALRNYIRDNLRGQVTGERYPEGGEGRIRKE